ncbi:MAG: NUDIX domain-containing protein [Parcubacteria group bacterium]|nr:NUDIX domain-containing protein [Parcubacteria group bacterium]
MIEYKKSSAVLVFNDKGELALQLRAAHDDKFPSHWDFSAGGGIDDGEDDALAARRELHEELGIDADVEFITKEHYTYPAWDPSITREVDLSVFKAHHNGPFKPDPDEVEKVQFFGLETIGEMMQSGVKFHPEFRLSWEKGIVVPAGNQ